MKPKTAVVMLNMGGPNNLEEVGPFLKNLFSDGEIITLGPLQDILGPLISSRRTPAITEQYRSIGGRSPIRTWTEEQGRGMVERLDKISPDTAPHKAYTMFRYAAPLTEETLLEMKRDGVERVVAFSQYPQFSCTTTGSSLNHLWRELKRLNLGEQFQWSVLDRWPTHPGFLKALEQRVQAGLDDFDENVRDRVVVVFSAHSLPMKVVNRGDQYVPEVAATANAVMER
jgi:ferrochelatase